MAQPATTPAPVVEAPAAPDAVGESGAPDEFEDEFGFVDETALAERDVSTLAVSLDLGEPGRDNVYGYGLVPVPDELKPD